MPMKHSHFLITLFNLALWDADKHQAPTRTEAWLDRRCTLFEQWCLPSVAAQRGARFRWLVMFDADSPEWLRGRIEDWRRRCPALEPCFIDAAETRGFAGRSSGREVGFIVSRIRQRLDPDATLLLTTNLDNDDALASDAMARIQAAAAGLSGPTVISLVNGLQLFPRFSAAIAMSYPHNHFLTLCEPIAAPEAPFATIESMSHRRARREFPVVDLRGQAGWIEVVHDSNVSNDLRITSRIGYRPIFRKVSLSRFGIVSGLTRRQQTLGTLRIAGCFFSTALRKIKRKLFRN